MTSRPLTCPTELDAGDVFSREGVEGVFVLRDEATSCVQTTDAAMADQGFSDGLFPTLTTEQARAVTEEVCKQFIQRNIAIPTLTITPKQQVSFGFRRFDLDLKNWNYQPLSRELLIQVLRTEKQTKLSSDAGGETPERLEDYLVGRLMDYPEVDYDSHADILYDLAGQVVRHFEAKHTDRDQLRSVIADERRHPDRTENEFWHPDQSQYPPDLFLA